MAKVSRGHRHHRITQEMSDSKVLLTMAAGKPAAIALLSKLYQADKGPFMYALYVLDSIGIYGSNIFRLYADVCDEDINKFYDVIHKVAVSEEEILNLKTTLGHGWVDD
ncbi:MAG: hypothetical protein IKE91_01045 [Clostridia bacterium]|nr:hypothetical protein [Clostridia bacterium]